MASVRILLTFDDGPHAATLGGKNFTENILDGLLRRGVRAAFFIQTHVSYRLPSPNGLKIATRIHCEGHVLAIHTGSFADHRCHKWRCTQPSDVLGTSNGLDSDMARAKTAIKQITGADPKFVRATYGYTDKKCISVYTKNSLKHVYWDIASGDDSRLPISASVHARLEAETKRLAKNNVDLIYLFHDINQITAEHLIEFIDTIGTSVRAIGNRPLFVADSAEAELIMHKKSRPGTDGACPPDSMG